MVGLVDGKRLCSPAFQTKLQPSSQNKAELMDVTQRLLMAISAGDWASYASLCAPDSTCIEPETMGQVVTGLGFHKHYFDLPPSGDAPPPPSNTTMTGVQIRVCPQGAMGFVTYNRLTQSGVKSSLAQETRIWEKQQGEWLQTHFHKSLVQ